MMTRGGAAVGSKQNRQHGRQKKKQKDNRYLNDIVNSFDEESASGHTLFSTESTGFGSREEKVLLKELLLRQRRRGQRKNFGTNLNEINQGIHRPLFDASELRLLEEQNAYPTYLNKSESTESSQHHTCSSGSAPTVPVRKRTLNQKEVKAFQLVEKSGSFRNGIDFQRRHYHQDQNHKSRSSSSSSSPPSIHDDGIMDEATLPTAASSTTSGHRNHQQKTLTTVDNNNNQSEELLQEPLELLGPSHRNDITEDQEEFFLYLRHSRRNSSIRRDDKKSSQTIKKKRSKKKKSQSKNNQLFNQTNKRELPMLNLGNAVNNKNPSQQLELWQLPRDLHQASYMEMHNNHISNSSNAHVFAQSSPFAERTMKKKTKKKKFKKRSSQQSTGAVNAHKRVDSQQSPHRNTIQQHKHQQMDKKKSSMRHDRSTSMHDKNHQKMESYIDENIQSSGQNKDTKNLVQQSYSNVSRSKKKTTMDHSIHSAASSSQKSESSNLDGVDIFDDYFLIDSQSESITWSSLEMQLNDMEEEELQRLSAPRMCTTMSDDITISDDDDDDITTTDDDNLSIHSMFDWGNSKDHEGRAQRRDSLQSVQSTWTYRRRCKQQRHDAASTQTICKSLSMTDLQDYYNSTPQWPPVTPTIRCLHTQFYKQHMKMIPFVPPARRAPPPMTPIDTVQQMLDVMEPMPTTTSETTSQECLNYGEIFEFAATLSTSGSSNNTAEVSF